MSFALGESGFSLVEVLIAGVILAVVVVGIALMFGEGSSFVVADGDDRVSIALAREKLEAVKGLGFMCIPLGGPGTVGIPMPAGACPDPSDRNRNVRIYNEGPFGRYLSRQTVVTCVDPNTFVPLEPCPTPPTGKRIAVEVVPGMAKARTIRVETFVGMRQPPNG